MEIPERQVTSDLRISRSFQTAPSVTAGEWPMKYLESTAGREGLEAPDWFCPDLEDSVPSEKVADGRQNIVDFTASNPEFTGEIWPRINWNAADADARNLGRADLEHLVQEAGDSLAGFIVPKVGRRSSVETAVETISEIEREYGFETERFEVCLVIETPEAVADLRRSASYGASTQRVTGLIFGPGDFTFDVGGRMTDGDFPSWTGIKEWITTIASANDLIAIGGTYPQVYNTEAGAQYYDAKSYAEKATEEATIGFDGSWSLHPSQTVQANTVHSPSAASLSRSINRLTRFAEADETGAMIIAGEVVDEAMVKQYRRIIETAVAIWEQSEQQARELYDAELLEKAAESLG